MAHEMHEPVIGNGGTRRGDARAGSDRAFGVTFAVIFAVLAAWPLLHGGSPRWWLLALAAALLAIAIAMPSFLAGPNQVWFRFSLLLGKIVSPVIIGGIFFAVATPTGLIMRLLGKNLLSLSKPAARQSYWVDRVPSEPSERSMRNQF